ncbi:hypothetical protein [Kitasatospora purpeofusca]|uniref:tyrosine-type recombinase/integrase n=1 Tax=Kitasatospora purpeofusca TaxID=67352 RepID=UPI002A599BF4|nr:hypothetical protein [Kitasatospora purpeofusca]MDY0814041.1 hypothetical protein [Kitasatospora purpeofusca]
MLEARSELVRAGEVAEPLGGREVLGGQDRPGIAGLLLERRRDDQPRVAQERPLGRGCRLLEVGDFAATWLRDRKLEESTRERYAITLRQYIQPGLGHRTLAEITPVRVRSWRSALLEDGAGEPSVVKAYQLLRAIMNTALDDELIQRDPCRIKGADTYAVPERPVLSVTEVFAVASAIGPRWRALVLLTPSTTLRFSELAALRRRDVDLTNRLVRVQRNQAELNSGRLYDKAPKSRAGFRPVAFPAEIVDDLAHHFDGYAGHGPDGHLFTGPVAASSAGATSGTTGSGPARLPGSVRMPTSTTSATPGTPSPRRTGPAPVSS